MNNLKNLRFLMLFISVFGGFFFPSLLYAQSTPWSFYNNPLQSNSMDIFYNGAGAVNPAIRIQPNGKIGLGINSPAARLDVFGDANSYAAIRGVTSGNYAGVMGQSTTASHVGVWGTAQGNVGVWGNSDNAAGVSGTSTNGYGVSGVSTNAQGVYASSTAQAGIRAVSTNYYGVYATSTNSVGIRGEGNGQPGVQGISQGNAGIYGYSQSNWGGYFHAATAPGAVYMRSDSGTPGSTAQIDRYTDAYLSGGSVLTMHNYGPRNDSSGYFIAATSDVNGNQGGADLEFYVRADGHVWADGAFTPNGADVAEWVPSKYTSEIEPGDLVMVDGSSSDSLTKKSDGTPYSSKLMGIVSTKPGILTGSNQDTNVHFGKDVMVTMSGRVPTKVSTENGTIQPGDFLTSSSTPGVAMKATQPGMTVGKALESYNGQTTGKIGVWVQSLWYGGDSDQKQDIETLKKELEILKQKFESLK